MTSQLRNLRGLLALAVTLACTKSGETAWKVDPDFRPLPTFGYSLPPITAIQQDGKFIVDSGRQRLNVDGSVDPTFASPNSMSREIVFSPGGQMFGLYFGPSTIAWLTSTGQNMATQVSFAPESANVDIVGFMSDGRFYVTGNFSAVNGVFRPGLARLNTNGTLDVTFDPGSGVTGTGFVTAATVQSDGKLLLAGTFTSFGGINRPQLVRLNLDGTVDLGFNAGPAIATAFPYTIAVDAQGRVLRADAGEIRRMAADGSNAVLLNTATFDPNPGQIWTLHPRADGSVVVHGVFTRIGTSERRWLAVVHEDGTVDESFDVGGLTMGVSLTDLLWSSELLIDPSSIHIQLNTGELVRLLPNGRVDPTFVLTAATRGRSSLTVTAVDDDGRLLIGGRFSHVDGIVRTGLVRLNADGTIDATFDAGAGVAGTIKSITIQDDGQILCGGTFASVDRLRRNGLARLAADGAFDATFDAGLPEGSTVNAVAVQSSGAIVIGGTFETEDGTPRARLARLLPNGSLDPSFVHFSGITGAEPVVHHVERLAGDQLLVSGSFDAWNGVRRWSVMRLNADGSLDSTFDPAMNTAGYALPSASAAPDGSVFAGGTTATSPTRGMILALDATGSSRFTTDASITLASVEVAAVLADPAGGFLSSIVPAGYPAYLERFHLNGTRDSALFPELGSGTVQAFTREQAGAVIIAGDFVGLDAMAFAGAARLVPDTPEPRLANISTRGYVGAGDELLIAGFYVSGDESQRVLIRGIGKSLEQFNLLNHATRVSIAIYRQGQSTPFAQNDVWWNYWTDGANTRLQRYFTQLNAFPLSFVPSRSIQNEDSALLLDLPPGGYTVHVGAATPGIGLVEVYDANGIGAARRLINISTRGRVGTNDEKLIAGFVVSEGTKRVLIRAVGPGIASLVGGTLADPMIELVRQSDHVTIATNDNWGDNANAAEIATVTPQVSGLPLANGSADAVLLMDLPTGAYTVVVSGAGNTTGIALAEVYEVP